jgi:hypothetical protein
MKTGMALSAFIDRIGMSKVAEDASTGPGPVYDVNISPGAIRQVDGNGLTHNNNGPAIIHTDGSTEWWWHGKRHRDEGPAIEYANGTKEWYMNHQNHRAGAPAVIKSCGDELWYQEGKLHREGGPAVTMADGSLKWFFRGDLHREDGPAIEKRSAINGQVIRQWYWQGKPSTEPEVFWRSREKDLRVKPPTMGEDLIQLFSSSEKLPHNPSGPARVWKDGTQEWFINGRRHRVDGPAVTLPNGETYYYLYDTFLSKAEHSVRVNTKENKPVEHIDTTSTATTSTEASVIPLLPAPKEERKVDAKLEEKVDDKDKNKVKQWPDEPDELVLYDEVFSPLKAILEKGYRLIRNATEWKFDYNGYEIGKMEKKIFPPAKEHFTEKFLKREKDKYDRSLFDVVMRLLFLMGIEQGRRMAYQEQAPVRTLQKTLSDYRERNKSVRYQLAKANAIIKIHEEHPNLSSDEMNKLIQVELEKTRQSRIDEIKKEIKMDPTLTCFKSKARKKAKLTELLALANTLDGEIFKQPDWLSILEEANCSQSEWKIFCKKNKFHKFIG